MTQTPNLMPGAPEAAAGPAELPDQALQLLRDVLQRVHLASAVFLRGEFTAPWGFTSTDAATLASVVAPGARQLVVLHVAVEGAFHLSIASGESALAQPGDAVVLPYCDVHSMVYPPGATAAPIIGMLPAPPWAELPVVCRIDGGGPATRVLCGYLSCDDLLFNPVLRALPRLIHVRAAPGPCAEWRDASLRYMLEQAGRGRTAGLLARLPEMVLVDCLRQYVESLPATQTGWLGALRDPVLGKALLLLHAQPAEPWTVAQLARRVGTSRSILAERFTHALGVSPMRYLVHWRLQLAADLLRSSRVGVAAVAQRVGYESEFAFSRAFKRHVGASPAAWREGVQPPGPAAP